MIFDDIKIPKAASRVGWLDPDHRISFTVVLAAKAPLPLIHAAGSGQSSSQAGHLTHAELRKKHGAVAGGAKLIETFAHSFKLEVTEMAEHRRCVRLSGRAADVGRAFKTRFEEFELHGHRFFAPEQPPSVPEKWAGMVETVLGLQNSPRAWPRRHSAVHGGEAKGRLHDLARAYGFPPGLDGTGETIALIEFGGGFYPEDIQQFCSRMGAAAPRITVVEVGSGANRPASRREIHKFLDVIDGELTVAAKTEQSDPFVAAQCTAEVTMDLEILAALAPGAHIVAYFASTDEQGLYHAVGRAVHDEQHKPGIVSMSWSIPEPTLPDSELHAVEGLLHEAAHLGMTVCVSSGDAGALNGSEDGKPSVNYPASSAYCLGCGGTSGSLTGKGIHEEVVWNAMHFGARGATGGGVSERISLPAWQDDVRVPPSPGGKKGRGVPDVAGLADPRYGCEMLIADRTFASAGTSAVAPMWAALIARLNQELGQRCGHLHPHLYRLGKERRAALHPVLKGNNGLYHAGEGWDACTGYGTPRGNDLLAHLKKLLHS
ncbi:MAG TPA: S53 family peptidase [Acidobacteriaceae bacterium]|nr:S53 family peptidase [Acidobacteriaceae bacterium]